MKTAGMIMARSNILVDFTGRKINGWEVLQLHKAGDNSPSEWKVRHKCGAERILRIAQLRSNGKRLCECRFKKPLVEEIKEMRKENAKVEESPRSLTPPKQFHQNTNPDRQRTLTGEEAEEKRMEHKKMSPREFGRLQAYNYARVVYRPENRQ